MEIGINMIKPKRIRLEQKRGRKCKSCSSRDFFLCRKYVF